MIIGCGGAGKSFLAIELSKILEIDVFHLDLLFWKPAWVETDKGTWKKIVEDVSSTDQWIIDGNYCGTMDIRLTTADTILFLDLPRLVCLWQVLKRRILFNNKKRPDIPEGCPERLSWEFIKWIWDFPMKTRPQIFEKLKACQDKKNIIVLRSNKDIYSFLEKMRTEKKCTKI
jgi:adenylate kinase family enzyme